MSKDFCLIEFKKLLDEIIISHSILYPEETDEDELQKIKEGKYISKLDVTFNGSLTEYFFKKLDVIQNNIIEEIDFNKGIANKHDFENYLFDIKRSVDFILGFFANNKITNELSWGNLKYSDLLNDFNLNEIYLDNIEIFKRTLYDKMIDFQTRLIIIPEYKDIHPKSQKSLTGNIKIEWKKQINQLVDFYLSQLEEDFIETDTDNLKNFLLNNFTWKGKPLSENTIATYFDPNKKFEKLPKGNKKINPSDYL